MAESPSAILCAWFERVWNGADEATIDALYAETAVAHGLPSHPLPRQRGRAVPPLSADLDDGRPDLPVRWRASRPAARDRPFSVRDPVSAWSIRYGSTAVRSRLRDVGQRR